MVFWGGGKGQSTLPMFFLEADFSSLRSRFIQIVCPPPAFSSCISGYFMRRVRARGRWVGFRIYQPNLPFNFGTESGRIGTPLRFTNGLLNPTRKTPIGSRPAGACFQRTGSVTARIVQGQSMSTRPHLPSRFNAYRKRNRERDCRASRADPGFGSPERTRREIRRRRTIPGSPRRGRPPCRERRDSHGRWPASGRGPAWVCLHTWCAGRARRSR